MLGLGQNIIKPKPTQALAQPWATGPSPARTTLLGPRLILSIRHYQAQLVTNSDEGTAMTTIAFQEGVQISTGGGM